MRYRRLLIVMSGALLACESPTSSSPLTLTLSASELNLAVGERVVLEARLADISGRLVGGPVTWSSADATTATVDARGLVVAIAVGATTVNASYGALNASVVVSVRKAVVGLSIEYEASTIIVGGTERFAASIFDSTGHHLNLPISWSTADSTVATVGAADGLVTGIGAGSTVIIAAAGLVADSVTVGVIRMDFAYSFARWTPAGANNFTTEVFSYSPTDGLTQSLERSAQFKSVAAPTWSTDGSLVVEVIHEFAYDASHFWLDYNSDLYVVEPSASWRALTTNRLSRAATWSPDGRRIAFLQQQTLFNYNDVYIVGSDGHHPVRVTTTSASYGAPRWSPDGLKLTFSDWSLLHNSEVFVVNADGTGLKNLSRHAAHDSDPSWSPDGRHIAFVSTRASRTNDPHVDLYVMDADGTHQTRLTHMTTYSGSPTWSADGRQIMFTSGGSLFVMNADGSSVARLTTPPNDASDVSPAWKR